MSQYQDFPGAKGGSESLKKLESLRLPNLSGLKVLDVGCNEGFFSGYASYENALEVIGIDLSLKAISRARIRFPSCDFRHQSWEELPEGRFDVILMLSAIHYAEDQEGLLQNLLSRLSPDGLLVLEIGIAKGGGSRWIEAERSIDKRCFPTRAKIAELFQKHAWKVVGYSVNQAGDPITRYVVHVRRKKPFVFLALENPGMGKSTICRELSESYGVCCVSADALYTKISREEISADKKLKDAIDIGFDPGSIDKAVKQVFEQDLITEIVDFWIKNAARESFVLDSYVPTAYRDKVFKEFLARGYFPVSLSWQNVYQLESADSARAKAAAYQDSLLKAPNKKAKTTFVKEEKQDNKSASIRWNIDSPVTGSIYVGESTLTVSGWIVCLNDSESNVDQVAIKRGAELQVHELSVERFDVIEHVFGDSNKNKNHKVGFSFSVDIGMFESGFELGYMKSGSFMRMAAIFMGDNLEAANSKKRKGFMANLKGYKPW